MNAGWVFLLLGLVLWCVMMQIRIDALEKRAVEESMRLRLILASLESEIAETQRVRDEVERIIKGETP